MTININPKWQLDIPGEFTISKDGRVQFREPLGAVLLPRDYLDFMKMSDGAVLRYRDAWFIARFPQGIKIVEIDYLSEMENVIGHSYVARMSMPNGFISIGASELEEMDILIGVEEGSCDYGKIYAWKSSVDPWMEGNNTIGLGFVADSFTEFMNNLTARENL